MNLEDIRDYVVRPALMEIALFQPMRVQQIIGTGLTESGFMYLDQTTPGPGPAYGFWQMERATHDDLWQSYINFQPSAIRDAMLAMSGSKYTPPVTTLHWNLKYAAAMCALAYRRAPGKHPAAGDFVGMAEYWKRYYNTPLGKGTIEKAIPFFKQAVSV